MKAQSWVNLATQKAQILYITHLICFVDKFKIGFNLSIAFKNVVRFTLSDPIEQL